MNAEDRVRSAFDDLDHRVARDVEPTRAAGAGAGGARPARRSSFRPGLAIAALAVVVAGGAAAVGLAGGGGDDQQVATGTSTTLDGDGVDPSDDATDDGADDDAIGATTSSSPDAEPDDPGADGPLDAGRYRVATTAVEADASDPFLNVRAGPDAGADLVAKLPATYTGLQATGATEEATDGGTWVEVELLDPVRVEGLDPDAPVWPPVGWVNAAFLEPLPEGSPVTTAEVPACAGGRSGGPDGGGAGGAAADVSVYALSTTRIEPDCLRVVVTFGTGPAAFSWTDIAGVAGPTDAVPEVVTTMSGGAGVTVDLGAVQSVWPSATETGFPVYVARQDDGSLELVVTTAADEAGLALFPDRGVAMIDLRLQGDPIGRDGGVVLTREPLIGAGTVDVVGLARPFEATLDLTITDGAGEPVEAVVSGTAALGTSRTSQYGVRTNDWLEAWGRFAVRVEGLAPGDYVLRFDAGGAIEDGPTTDVAITITDAGDEPTLADDEEQAAAQRLIAFASSGQLGDLALADEVVLALGPEPYRVATATELATPEAWTTDPADGFAGFVGPFNPLDQLRRTGHRITAGPTAACAGPARTWPSAFDGLRQVNVEPVGIDSCIAWYGVHLFLDGDGRVAGVALDLFGP